MPGLRPGAAPSRPGRRFSCWRWSPPPWPGSWPPPRRVSARPGRRSRVRRSWPWALAQRRTTVTAVGRSAAVPFLLFVLGLGIVVQAVVTNGLDRVLGPLVPGGTSLPALLATAALSAALAHLINNLPAVLVLLPLAAPAGPGAVLAVLAGVNIGPNLTYTGSLATLLWRRVLHERGSGALARRVHPPRAAHRARGHHPGGAGPVGLAPCHRRLIVMTDVPAPQTPASTLTVLIWVTEGTWRGCVDAARVLAPADAGFVLLHVSPDEVPGAAHGAHTGPLGRGHPERDPRAAAGRAGRRGRRGPAGHGRRPAGPPLHPHRAPWARRARGGGRGRRGRPAHPGQGRRPFPARAQEPGPGRPVRHRPCPMPGPARVAGRPTRHRHDPAPTTASTPSTPSAPVIGRNTQAAPGTGGS
jgi:Arsenical pump membrane protein